MGQPVPWQSEYRKQIPGQPVPEKTISGQPGLEQLVPRQPVPEQPGHGQQILGHPIPRQPIPGKPGHGQQIFRHPIPGQVPVEGQLLGHQAALITALTFEQLSTLFAEPLDSHRFCQHDSRNDDHLDQPRLHYEEQ